MSILPGCRILVGGLFTAAGFSKMVRFPEFLLVLSEFNLVPAEATMPVAMVIVSLETGLGLALTIGLFTRPVAAALALMTGIFVVAITVALINGNAVECGCFGSFEHAQIGPGVLARDMLVILVCILLLKPGPLPFSLDNVISKTPQEESYHGIEHNPSGNSYLQSHVSLTVWSNEIPPA